MYIFNGDDINISHLFYIFPKNISINIDENLEHLNKKTLFSSSEIKEEKKIF